MPQFDPNTYVDVQERINRFWLEHKDGAITTELAYARDFDNVVILASVFKHKDDAKPSATGIAGEERGKDYKAGANFTSWHENAETSAIGRALANMGYATSREDRPSRQEMTKAASSERRAELVKPAPLHGAPKATAEQNKKLHWEAEQRGLNHDDLHALAMLKGHQHLDEMSGDQVETLKAWVMTAKPSELDIVLARAGRPTMDQRAANPSAR